VVAKTNAMFGLAADFEHVYWADGGKVFAALHTDIASSLELMDIGKEGFPAYGNTLALDTTYVYAAGQQGTMRVHKSGEQPPELLTDAIARVAALGVTADHVYVGRQHSVSGPGSMFRAPLSGGALELLRAEGDIRDIDVTNDRAYWGDAGTMSGPAGSQQYDDNGAIGWFDASGGAVLLEALTAAPLDIAVDETHIYWPSFEWGPEIPDILRLPKDGGTTEMVANAVHTNNLAAASEGIYAALHQPRELRFMPQSAAGARCVARLPQEVPGTLHEIVLTDEIVYVAVFVHGQYHGAVVRTPRPEH